MPRLRLVKVSLQDMNPRQQCRNIVPAAWPAASRTHLSITFGPPRSTTIMGAVLTLPASFKFSHSAAHLLVSHPPLSPAFIASGVARTTLYTSIQPSPALLALIRMSATTPAEAVSSQITDEPVPSNERVPSNEPLPPKAETIHLGNLAADIVPHILNLYNCTATAADYEMYDLKATFEDPVMQAHGVKQIKSAFYSIPKVFKEAKMVEYTVTEVESAPNSGEISIDNLQRYKLGSKTIDMISLIKLQVENGKVVRHVDMWNKKPLLDRDTVKVPLMGRLVEKLRRGNMLVTHLFMGGKDPKPQS
ncbi:hypothetical protein KC19_8G023600 [Ceratodon purpureus]|uniref:SnoaL-like domain-containing protein n=1 Tax=Ceratodon purpureus TaxID=3225 RepID=A0A8T0GUE6_CERPU|nr:hypothetical protein KC19_8G023600 [Ceratodon purpureus]